MNLFKYFASFERLALPKLGVLFEFDLKEYLLSHLDEVQDFDFECKYTNKEVFEELIEIIDENLQKIAA